MCGIFAFFDRIQNVVNVSEIVTNTVELLHHRGPDSHGEAYIKHENAHILFVHTRLEIQGDSSPQPLYSKDKSSVCIVNGEIFNWKELEDELGYRCTKSDCEIILPLYSKYKDNPQEIFKRLEGQYSFVLYDTVTCNLLIGRDHIGITPLYIGTNGQGRFVVASELKAVIATTGINDISVCEPRHFYHGQIEGLSVSKDAWSEYVNYYEMFDMNMPQNLVQNTSEAARDIIQRNVAQLLQQSVKSQLVNLKTNSYDFGVLLSGGLDSSLIAAIVAKSAGRKIKTFSIGMDKDVPDLVAARRVAAHIGSDHHEYYFTIEEGLDEIRNVVWNIETYDCTTIRASTPMMLLTSKIKRSFPDIKVLFSGELSDELFCYLYGANAPSARDFQLETINLVNNVHFFDCQRANKSCMISSIEVRVPFTDSRFVEYILSLHPKWKMFGPQNGQMEKQLLRDSFKGWLPTDILYRKKEQFSDGVSGFGDKNNWIDGISKWVEQRYDDDEFMAKKDRYVYNRPDTKEKLWYRELFCELFNSDQNSSELLVRQWVPKWSGTTDPSGRVQTFWKRN